MKNLLIRILIALLFLSFVNISFVSNTYAETKEWTISVKVTEKIPWADCVEDTSNNSKWNNKLKVPLYKCEVSKWFGSIMVMLWNIIKYFTYIASLWWVLFIVVNGIMYSMWWVDQSLKDEAKKRITWTLVWLILLFLSWIILNLIAPWIYK